MKKIVLLLLTLVLAFAVPTEIQAQRKSKTAAQAEKQRQARSNTRSNTRGNTRSNTRANNHSNRTRNIKATEVTESAVEVATDLDVEKVDEVCNYVSEVSKMEPPQDLKGNIAETRNGQSYTVFRTNSGRVYAYDKSSKRYLQVWGSGAKSIAFSSSEPGVVYIGTADGKVRANLNNGRAKMESESKDEEMKPASREVFTAVEQMPEFPGGQAALLTFISSHIQYPQAAADHNVQGKVYVKFVVTSTGKVDRVQIARSVDKALDQEALRVCRMLPNFTPGRQDGQAVNVWYTLPVTFKLNN